MVRTLLKYRIQVITIVTSILLVSLPFFVPHFVQYLFYSVYAFIFLVACYSFIAHDYFDTKLAGFVLAVFLFAKILFASTDSLTLTFRTAAFLAFALLHLVLLIGPWSRFSKYVRKQYKHRRHLGVTVFYLGALHGILLFQNYFTLSLTSLMQAIFAFFGFTALYIFSLLAITSWDWIQKRVSQKQWYVFHTAVLLVYTFFVYLFFRQQVKLDTINAQRLRVYMPIAFLVFGFLVAPYSLVKRLFYQVLGWKQLHVLIYIAYLSLIIHFWSGIEYVGVLWTKSIVLFSMAVVLGSHAYGWFMKWREDERARSRVTTLNKSLVVNGETYVGIARTTEFQDGKGEKFIVNKTPLAVFKFKNEYRAISNNCAHQNGPLYQGLLTAAGYVVCPWHQYSFSLKDGKGPPGYTDCVPAYKTLEQNGVVYVCV